MKKLILFFMTLLTMTTTAAYGVVQCADLSNVWNYQIYYAPPQTTMYVSMTLSQDSRGSITEYIPSARDSNLRYDGGCIHQHAPTQRLATTHESVFLSLNPWISFASPRGGNMMTLTHYVLFLCIQSALTCSPATYNVKTVEGLKHAPYVHGTQPDCLDKAREISKAAPDDKGRFFVASNRWYECHFFAQGEQVPEMQ